MPTKFVTKTSQGYMPSPAMKKIAWVSDKNIYEYAAKDPLVFWDNLAKQGIVWEKHWSKTYVEKLPYFKWFKGGKLNFCVNALDRHLDNPSKTALIWVPEPTGEKPVKITYGELYDKVNKFANVLKNRGVKKGDVVAIYMPLIPESLVAMLACTRIGAIHSVVFSAFSADALKARIIDGKTKVLISADGYYRRGKSVDLLTKVKSAIRGTKVKHVIVANRLSRLKKSKKISEKFLDFDNEVESANSYCEPEIMNSEDPLFILYTSGTTGKPKGVVHDTGGYAVQTYWTTKWVFNLRKDDIMWCTADIGWITGHTYAFYGPLLLGNTTLIYEGTPDFPNFSRWWKIVDKHKVNVFYTAPTAIRMFIKAGEQCVANCRLDSLKILGTVGEPIDKYSWNWYFKKIGKSRCPIIDTWWQTETGGTLINVLPGIGPFVPTVAGKSFPGTKHIIVNEKGKEVKPGKPGFLVQTSPFAPGMLHDVYKNPKKYKETYWQKFGKYYDTSDGANTTGGLIRVTGRTDDVMKVAGHRLSTAELEDALDSNEMVSESAVVPIPDKVRGQVPVAFIVLKSGEGSNELVAQLKKHIDLKIGPTARPAKVYFVGNLPKTRSGKIMRRILKSILVNEKPKGLMTLVNPKSVNNIKDAVNAAAFK